MRRASITSRSRKTAPLPLPRWRTPWLGTSAYTRRPLCPSRGWVPANSRSNLGLQSVHTQGTVAWLSLHRSITRSSTPLRLHRRITPPPVSCRHLAIINSLHHHRITPGPALCHLTSQHRRRHPRRQSRRRPRTHTSPSAESSGRSCRQPCVTQRGSRSWACGGRCSPAPAGQLTSRAAYQLQLQCLHRRFCLGITQRTASTQRACRPPPQRPLQCFGLDTTRARR